MPVTQYFAYGSNMLTERLQQRCPSARARMVAAADNWELGFCKRGQDGSGKATLFPATGCRVFGVVFDVDQSELPELDRFESAGKGYDRQDDFQVSIADSEVSLEVMTYIARHASTDPSLRPYDWYLNLVRAGVRQHALPLDYRARLEAILPMGDPKSDRPTRLAAIKLLETVVS